MRSGEFGSLAFRVGEGSNEARTHGVAAGGTDVAVAAGTTPTGLVGPTTQDEFDAPGEPATHPATSADPIRSASR